MAELRIQGLEKTFKDGHTAVAGISFDLADREAVFLLGPSGAGKTTTLRLVAGLEDASAGRIRLGSRDVTDLTPRERNVAMVYDKHSLFPHLSIFENLAYPLRVRKMPEAAMKARIAEIAAVLQIERLMDRLPAQISGGQQQRVAIGRALVREADCYLLDEPISHLDAQLRARMRVEFKRLQRDFKATMLYVSHDQLEAMTMADRIVLINKGRIEQIAAPQELFDRPLTQFAATFIGEPVMNTLPAHVRVEAGKSFLVFGTSRLPVDPHWLARGETLPRDVVVGVRPQQIALSPVGETVEGRIEGVIFAVETLGTRVIFDIDAGGTIVRVMTTVDMARHHSDAIGAPIAFRVPRDFIYLFDPITGRTLRQAQFTERPAA
jgi:ABC-type sugar transport system ATPase subunit